MLPDTMPKNDRWVLLSKRQQQHYVELRNITVFFVVAECRSHNALGHGEDMRQVNDSLAACNEAVTKSTILCLLSPIVLSTSLMLLGDTLAPGMASER